MNLILKFFTSKVAWLLTSLYILNLDVFLTFMGNARIGYINEGNYYVNLAMQYQQPHLAFIFAFILIAIQGSVLLVWYMLERIKKKKPSTSNIYWIFITLVWIMQITINAYGVYSWLF